MVVDCRYTPVFVDVDLSEIFDVECRLKAEYFLNLQFCGPSPFRGIDVLVIRSDFVNVTMEEVDLSMQVNLKSAVKLSQACLPHLQAGQGSIVNVSSIAGLRAYPGALAYKMSKAAMDQMTRCVALEVKH